MDRFAVLEYLGDGAFGSVIKARYRESGEVVAIKKMKRRYASWDECVSLGEVQSLLRLSHPNIVRLREVFRQNSELYFVFEYADAGSLHALIQAHRSSNTPIGVLEIARLMHDILQGLQYMHASDLMHRDLKPDNILLSSPARDAGQGEEPERLVAKIADFGTAREYRPRAGAARSLTEYIGTRWYRAPEMLWRRSATGMSSISGLPHPNGLSPGPPYGPPADVWACGCILGEMLLLRPLFPGRDELDTLARISEKLSADPAALLVGAAVEAPRSLVALLLGLLRWRPKERLTAAQALRHPFFAEALAKAPGSPRRALPPPAPADARDGAPRQRAGRGRTVFLDDINDDTFVASLAFVESALGYEQPAPPRRGRGQRPGARAQGGKMSGLEAAKLALAISRSSSHPKERGSYGGGCGARELDLGIIGEGGVW